jgi:putative flippase GtrA
MPWREPVAHDFAPFGVKMTHTRETMIRWMAFNAVGAVGIGVQLATLWVLVRLAQVPALVATAIAVEAAVLHNFAWHQRWTWKDRPADAAGTLARLWRFHVLNGAVSMAGNLLVVAVLTRALHVDPVVASAIAIACCALVNFAASERLVFRSAVVALAVLAPAADAAAGPTAATVSAWNSYVTSVELRFNAAAAGGTLFLARDGRESAAWQAAARRGEVTTFRVDAPAAADGRIHHWIGAVFVPGATVEGVVNRLQHQAGRESESYQDVLASKLLRRDGPRLSVFMKLRRSAIITVTYNTEHDVEYRRLGSTRATNRSVATKIAELSGAGTASEREKPAGSDSGFLWRLNAYWRYQQVDGGVLIECESVSLSRVVPFAVRPFVSPIVERIARESLERTLVALRADLSARRP